MSVDVNRHFDAVVGQLISYIGERLTCLNEKACMGMTEIMYPNLTCPRFLYRFLR
jgi:hypothetical protein